MIDVQDSTPDVSCELLTVSGVQENQQITTSTPDVSNVLSKPSFQNRLGAPARHSDIYITDVYNVNEHTIEAENATPETTAEPPRLETINESITDKSLISQDEQIDHKGSNDSVKLFRKVREYVGDFLEPPEAPPVSVTPDVTVEGDTKISDRSYVNLHLGVKCTVMRTKAADGGTINELVSVQCYKHATDTSTTGSSGIHGDVSRSSSSSSDLPPPPPPPAGSSVIRHKSRFSHASSTSSTSASSIASSASALARINADAAYIRAAVAITERSEQAEQTSPEIDTTALSHERIGELRDKWMNSREVWRLLDYIDRIIDKNEFTPEMVDTTQLTSRRGRKTKQTDNEWTKPDEQSDVQMPRPAKRRKPAEKAEKVPENSVKPTPESSTFCVGSQVFAKWTDRRFYAATLINMLSDGRWMVEFYDGNQRPVSEEHMLYVDDVAIIGQKVFARAQSLTEPEVGDDFHAGIVTACEPDETGTQLMFTVISNDNDIRVPSEHISLTEHQVRQVKKNPSANGDHRGSPLPSASSRSTRSKTRCATINSRVDSPIPGSSGTQTQRRRQRNASNGQTRQRGRGRPRRQITESTRTAVTTDENRDYVDYDDYDDDDDSCMTNCTSNGDGNGIGYGDTVDVSGLEPEAAASYDASGHIKGKTHVDGKATRFGHEPREEEAAALGPMPAPGSQLFKGMHVLLSCASESSLLSTSTTRNIDNDSDCGDGSSSCASGGIDFKFSTRPFVKARLKAQLIAGGAVVHDSLEDVPTQKLGQTYLIANRPSRTAAYVACIAAGIRVYCHDWVIRCCAEGKCLQPQELPYGWSIEKERYFMSHERPRTQGSGCGALKRKLLLISDGGDAHFTGYWTHVIKLSGATVKNLSLCDENEVSRALCVLCDCGHRDERAVHAHRRGVHLVTTTWLVQTLIHGEIRKFDISCYRPDYADQSD